MRRAACLLVVCAAASVAWACNVQKSATGPTPPGSQSLTRLSRTRFLAFGDSLTSGEIAVASSGEVGLNRFPHIGLVVIPSASYPSQLASQLKSRYPSQASAIDVMNAGLPNEWAQDGALRFSSVAANARAEVLLLVEGDNDLAAQGQAGISPASRALESMVRDARGRGMRVFLATLPPPRAVGMRSLPVALVTSMNTSIRSIASAQGAVLVDLYTALSADIPRYIGNDGLHPTEAGYQRIAEVFGDTIRTDLEVRTAAVD